MKKPSELKRGDIVYTYSDDRRHTNYECIVLRNGHKYIKTDGVIQQDKFDKETMTCVDWSSWHLFPGT